MLELHITELRSREELGALCDGQGLLPVPGCRAVLAPGAVNEGFGLCSALQHLL